MKSSNVRKQKISENGGKMLYAPIIQKIEYWRDYTGTGDLYRQKHDLDCILTGGNLYADTIFSLWLPLRYSLNYYDCAAWKDWKEYEFKANQRLKDCPAFLNDLIANIEDYLPPTGQITSLLAELFYWGQKRENVMLLPYRSWNNRRGYSPYYDYMPHFIFDLMSTNSPLFLQALQNWIKEEHLTMFFIDGKLDREHVKDLAGTGAPWMHSPTKINLEELLNNYIEILKERAIIISTVA